MYNKKAEATEANRQALREREKAHNDVVNGLAPEYVPENTPERYLEAVQQYNQVTRPLYAEYREKSKMNDHDGALAALNAIPKRSKELVELAKKMKKRKGHRSGVHFLMIG